MVVISETPVVELAGTSGGGKRRGSVLITGRGTDIAFNLDENAPMEQIARDLDAQLAGHSALFSEGGISVNIGDRALSEAAAAEIRRIFRERSGLKVARFISANGPAIEDLRVEVADLRVGVDEPPPRPPQDPPVRRTRRNPAPLSEFSSADLARALSGLSSQGQRTRDHALVVRATVRSGETVRHAGDLVVLGDVNPGSEVLAEGDIVVMGTLKGLPHAGASGDSKAAVVALEIAAPRIRIGNCEAHLPGIDHIQGGKKGRQGPADLHPKIAYVRHGSIHVSPFTGRTARYTKGVPYEG